MSDDIETVSVELGEESYSVLIGENLIENAAQYVQSFVKNTQKIAVIASSPVAKLYGESLQKGLAPLHISISFIEIPDGESSKSFAMLEEISRKVLQAELSRNDLLIALGGGVAGDLIGFAAAIYKRGIKFIQIPTTLLAQVDSSVGGKTGINTSEGKNLIGAFHQPSLVLADTTVLNSLPKRDMLSGYAEVIKYALLGDADFFEWLDRNAQFLISGAVEPRIYAIKRSVEMKAGIVSRDELEQGERMLLNLGHTFGHAFEAFFGYSGTLFHGEAVALGIMCAFEYSHKIGLCSAQDVERVKAHFEKIGLPIHPKQFGITTQDLSKLMQLMGQDKKVSTAGWTFILCDKIGTAKIVKGVDPKDIGVFLGEYL